MTTVVIDKKWCEKNANPCPKCKKHELVARSERVREDCCEVWIECVCGYDGGLESSEIIESIMGLDQAHANAAFSVWQDKTS